MKDAHRELFIWIDLDQLWRNRPADAESMLCDLRDVLTTVATEVVIEGVPIGESVAVEGGFGQWCGGYWTNEV